MSKQEILVFPPVWTAKVSAFSYDRIHTIDINPMKNSINSNKSETIKNHYILVTKFFSFHNNILK